MNYKRYLAFVLVFLVTGCAGTQVISKKIKKKKQINYNVKSDCEQKAKYFKLLARLTKNSSNKAYFLNNSMEYLCDTNYKKTMAFMEYHKERIGIIFEGEKKLSDKNKSILAGVIKSARKSKFKKTFVIKKVKLTNKSVNMALSDLVLKKKVGVIITWGSPKLVSRIQKWQKGLKVPTLFIDSKVKRSKDSFRVFPNRTNYSVTMADSLVQRNIKRIAILTPQHAKKSKLLKKIKKEMKARGIEIVHDVHYDSQNYETMDLACRKIFTINRQERHDEYVSIFKAEKAKAEQKGYKLNWSSVFLPAQVDYDAIFIPDNFKMVHHFIKLFQFYKAPKITLVGNHEWRSQELLNAHANYLAGAIFVDFIGNKNDLPITSKAQRKAAPTQSLDANVDYKLMGYYTGHLSQRALKSSKLKRTQIRNRLRQIRIKDKFLNNSPAFINHEFNWPSFSFEVMEDDIVIKDAEVESITYNFDN